MKFSNLEFKFISGFKDIQIRKYRQLKVDNAKRQNEKNVNIKVHQPMNVYNISTKDSPPPEGSLLKFMEFWKTGWFQNAE